MVQETIMGLSVLVFLVGVARRTGRTDGWHGLTYSLGKEQRMFAARLVTRYAFQRVCDI
jgi:hypothetical protein